MRSSAVAAILGLMQPALYATQPNVVFIMADDIGLGDIGLYHRERTGTEPVAPTPNLDRLARAGVRFSDAHSSTALCSPTRYCVMSGNYNYRSYAPWGVWGSFRPTPFTKSDATLGRIAREGGLTTAFVGKWHLGGDFLRKDGQSVYRGNDRHDRTAPVDVSRIVGGGPQSAGFDYSYTMPCGIQGPLYVAYENGEWSPLSHDSELIYLDEQSALDPALISSKGPGMGDSRWDATTVGPLVSDKAVAFIEREANAERPFFLCYWTPMVHVPHLPPESFDGKPIRGETPTRHLDMVLDLDQQVGRIVTALERTGVVDNTLLIFSSDNGGLIDRRAARTGHDSSGGYRGSKNLAFEGGHRLPFFAAWPGRIANGVESDALVVVHDVVATIAALLNVRLGPEQAKDSHSLWPLLEGDPGFIPREELFLQGGSGLEVVYRQGDWKLIVQGDRKLTKWDPIALFNLADSPLEEPQANLLGRPEHSERVARMLDKYLSIRRSGERTATRIN